MGSTRSTFDEDDEDEDDGRQKVELREDSISLDQVICIIPVLSVALTSTYRRGGLPCKVHGEAQELEHLTLCDAGRAYLFSLCL